MMNKLPALIFAIILSAAGAASCSGGGASLSSATMTFTNPDGSSSPALSVELARTKEERTFGLMYRKQLPPENGMLFVFPTEEPLSFWMRNTYLELDMIFIDSSFRVVSIVERAAPLTDTPRPSGAPARYVLEVLGGSAARWGIRPGSLASVSGLSN